MKKYTYNDVKRDFEKKGYILLVNEEEYKNVKQNLKFICPIHGEQEITYSHLRQGRGCPICGKEKARKSRCKPDEYYKKLAEEKGFEFIRTFSDENNKRCVEVICPVHISKGIQKILCGNLKKINTCKYCANIVKKSQEEYKEEIYNLYGNNITVIDNYINNNTKIKMYCNIHNMSFEQIPSNLLKGHIGCPECSKEARSKSQMKSKNEFQEQVNVNNPHIKIITYKGMGSTTTCYCKLHNKTFNKHPTSLIRGHSGCDECYKENTRNFYSKSQSEFEKELREKHPELTILGKYVNKYTEIELYCNTHNESYTTKPYLILNKNSCCPKGSKYVKEKDVCKILEKYNIKYIQQKTFDDCKDKSFLYYDFYLPDYNTCIEYQGEQHYFPINYSKDQDKDKKFEYTKRHDKIKKEYCKKENIPLIEIPYWEYDNMEYFLLKELKKNNINIS